MGGAAQRERMVLSESEASGRSPAVGRCGAVGPDKGMEKEDMRRCVICGASPATRASKTRTLAKEQRTRKNMLNFY